jgi:hypothetical protein
LKRLLCAVGIEQIVIIEIELGDEGGVEPPLGKLLRMGRKTGQQQGGLSSTMFLTLSPLRLMSVLGRRKLKPSWL